MLQGLGQHLRCCGVDVTIMDNNSDHAKLLEVRLTYRSFADDVFLLLRLESLELYLLTVYGYC